MKILRTSAVLTLALAPAAFAMPAHAAEDATVSILHGVPGATVDVYANGDSLLSDFAPGTLTDPVMLPAGEYDLKVTAAGAGADGDAVIEANDVAVPAGRQHHGRRPPRHLGQTGPDAIRQRHVRHRRGSGPHHRPPHRSRAGRRRARQR